MGPLVDRRNPMRDGQQFFYGWVNVALAFLAITTYGLFYSYSVFLESLEAELQCTRAVVSAVYTLEMAVYCIWTVLWGRFSDTKGPRKALGLAALLVGGGTSLCSLVSSVWHLYLFFGIIAAMGHGAVWVVPIATLNRWFTERRGLAVGIAMCGLGFGLLVVPPVAAELMNAFGWRTAFLLLGTAFFLLNTCVAFLLRGQPRDGDLSIPGHGGKHTSPSMPRQSAVGDFTVHEALRAKNFWMLYLVFLFSFAGEQMVMVHIVPYATAIGVSIIRAAVGLSFLGVGTIIGRVGFGALSDRIGRVPTLIMTCGIEAGSIFAMVTIDGPFMLYAIMFLLGSVYGGTAVLCSAMLGDFFGLRNVGVIMGLWATSGVPAGVLGPLMAGVVFDATGSYFWALLIAGTVCLGAVLAAVSIKNPAPAPSG